MTVCAITCARWVLPALMRMYRIRDVDSERRLEGRIVVRRAVARRAERLQPGTLAELRENIRDAYELMLTERPVRTRRRRRA
jgi:hypothetical protein